MSFVGLYTGLSGVRAAQTGIDTTSHNVANASTPGYTRQRVELTAKHAYDSLAGPVGTGVNVESIARLRDGFLDDRYRSAVGEHGAESVRSQLLQSAERLTGEPDNGIASKLSRLWDAAENWSNAPDDTAARRQVIAELSSVSETVRSVSGSWNALEADTHGQQEALAATVTNNLKTIDELNTKLAGAQPSRTGPDLHDQRDLLLDEVARLTGATVGIDADGRAQAELDGQQLLTKGAPASLHAAGGELYLRQAGATFDPEAPGAPVPPDALSGELGGLREFLQEDLRTLSTNLDAFAATFAGAVNTINQTGPNAANLMGFGDPAAAGNPADASTLRVLGNVGPETLVAGDDPTKPHDGTNARAFADLRSDPVADNGTANATGTHLEGRLADMVTGLAGNVRAARAGADAARATYRGADLARTSEHGVSIDEEMVGLVRYQRAMEASARVMTTVDEALQVLVNRTGIVGR